MGNLLHVNVHAANVHDTKAGCAVASAALEKYPSLKGFSADAGYRKTFEEFVRKVLEKNCEISHKIKDTFAVLPIRWIVERTLAWISNHRRLAKDYEILAKTAEAFVKVAMIRVTLNKLYRNS